MKIVFFSPYFYPYTSGITTYPLHILSHLAKKHSVTVLTFPHSNNLPVSEIYNGIHILRMPYLFKISKGFISLQSLWYFITLTKKADLVLLNLPNIEGLPLALLAKVLRKKTFSIFHCNVTLGKDIFSLIISLLLNFSVYIQALLSTGIFAYTEDYVTHRSNISSFKNKIAIVLPPIPYNTPDKEKLKELNSLKKDHIWIGYAGRIAREKGLDNLIHAVSQLPDKKQYTIVFGGPYGKDVAGEEQYYHHVKTLLEEKNIPYFFFGNLSKDDLAAFYKTIDVLTLPSINSTEAFGMVQAEAMLQGTPVIASNLPGVRVPIQMTHMGLMVEPGNIQSLTKAITEVLTHKPTYTNTQLIKKAHELFHIENTFKIYDRIVS